MPLAVSCRVRALAKVAEIVWSRALLHRAFMNLLAAHFAALGQHAARVTDTAAQSLTSAAALSENTLNLPEISAP